MVHLPEDFCALRRATGHVNCPTALCRGSRVLRTRPRLFRAACVITAYCLAVSGSKFSIFFDSFAENASFCSLAGAGGR